MCSLSAVYYDENAAKDLLSLANSGTNRGDESIGFGVRVKDNDEWKYIVTKAMRKDGGISAAYNDMIVALGETEVSMGIAQTRYSTRGKSDKEHAQPFRANVKHDIIVGHNGTLANSRELAKAYRLDCITESDTEVLALLISDSDSVKKGAKKLVKEAKGSYNFTVLDDSNILTAFRDPMGFHPLWYGSGEKGEFYVASESSAFDSLGCSNVTEMKPGEMIQVSENGIEKSYFGGRKISKCVFEPFYFEKPWSKEEIQGNYNFVEDIRYKIGILQGKKEDVFSENGITVPVLDSGAFYAKGFAETTGMPYREAIKKNMGSRIYMDPDIRDPQGLKLSRKEKVNLKHVVIPERVIGKDVYVIDDSIVRSDTSSKITENLRKAKAKKVHWRIAFPMIKYGCIYGLDHSVKKDLIGARLELEEKIAEEINADSVKFLKVEDMPQIFGDINNYCFACASGIYPTPVPKECISAIEL